MSVTINNLMAYGSANMPETDSVVVGGAVDFSKRVMFYDISPAGFVDWVSTSTSDTATRGQVTGRDSTGAIQTPSPPVTLTGQTVVTGSQTFQRLGAAVITGGVIAGLSNPGGTAAQGDVALMAHTCVLPASSVTTDTTYRTAQAATNTSGTTPPTITLQAGDGASVAIGQLVWTRTGTGSNQLRMIVATTGFGTDVVAVNRDWATLPVSGTTYKIVQGMLFDITNSAGAGTATPVVAITRCFWTAAAQPPTGAQAVFYEKIFVVNNNSATTATQAQIEIASESPTLPSGTTLYLGLTTALNDTNTINPRQQASSFLPPGVTAFFSQPQFINVPSPGNLPAGNAPNAAGAQGCWLQLTLPAGAASYNGSADLRISAATT